MCHLKTCTLDNCSSPPPVWHPVVPLTIQLWPKKSPSPPSPCTQRCEEPPATAPINATVMYSTVGEMSVEFQSPGSPAAMHHPDCDCVCWRANCRRKRLSRESLCESMCVCARDCDCVSSNLRRQLLSINHKRAKREPLHFYHHYQYGAGLWKN